MYAASKGEGYDVIKASNHLETKYYVELFCVLTICIEILYIPKIFRVKIQTEEK